ncbi:TPA: hypothetical protein ACJ5DT_003113 [Legionella pneumophila]|nr:hypothetical protein [Legionella pneumophila]MCW8427648.1 hypothetical protein [Legionella pneumophila]CZG59613.1 Uncharacterised protein [Legionella pneumophila]CZG68512.1 Uncharacterised protein [Legionella pneumophila]
MARFKTHEERMKHRHAKLIPASMWHDNQLFYEVLDESVLSIMKAKTSKDAISLLVKYLPKLNDQWKKKQAWLGIALTQLENFSILLESAKILGFSKNNLFSLFAILGNVKFLNEYAKESGNDGILEMIKDNQFYPYKKAAEHGNLDVLTCLETWASSQILEMILANDFYAYKQAAHNGHINVIKHLETKAPGYILQMIQAQDYYGFRLGASGGHIELLKHMQSKAPQLFDKMVAANNFFAYRASLENGHFEVSNWLLSNSSSCLAYAEAHRHEYGTTSVNPFIENRLAVLHREAINLPPPAVFDIQDTEQAKICFYMIRNLIRRNERNLDDEIKFLLNIPSVKALAHTVVTPNQPNELIRLALTTGNHEAASILLNIPEVRVLSEENDFYRDEVNGKLDLAQLSRDSESSMTSLTKGEKTRLNEAIKRYRPTLESVGTAKLMQALRDQLKERYMANPASIINEEGRTIILPMDFEEFKQIKLSKKDYELALKSYFQNKNHTAWRYLAKPNPWMHPEAEYIYIDKLTSAKWSTFEEYQPLIAMLWLAATDKEAEPTDGHTIESRLDHFVEELALIGRSHNWDKTRINSKNQQEEYDDLEGDRPSCYSGVKRRLFQSVLGHPLITILTEDMVLEEIRTFARQHFQLFISEAKKAALKEAFDDYIVNINEISTTSKELLISMNIPPEKQEEFEGYLSKKYGAQYTEDFAFISIVRNKLSLSSDKTDFFGNCHALMLDGNVGLYQMLENTGELKTDSNLSGVRTSQIGFFKHKKEETIADFCDEAPSPPSPEI